MCSPLLPSAAPSTPSYFSSYPLMFCALIYCSPLLPSCALCSKCAPLSASCCPLPLLFPAILYCSVLSSTALLYCHLVHSLPMLPLLPSCPLTLNFPHLLPTVPSYPLLPSVLICSPLLPCVALHPFNALSYPLQSYALLSCTLLAFFSTLLPYATISTLCSSLLLSALLCSTLPLFLLYNLSFSLLPKAQE